MVGNVLCVGVLVARLRREALGANPVVAAELASALAASLQSVAALRLAVRTLAARPGPEAAERAALRLALRTGSRDELPLTGSRALLWLAWMWTDGDASPRARWLALRASVEELAREGAAGAAGMLLEVDALDPDGADPVASAATDVDARWSWG